MLKESSDGEGTEKVYSNSRHSSLTRLKRGNSDTHRYKQTVHVQPDSENGKRYGADSVSYKWLKTHESVDA